MLGLGCAAVDDFLFVPAYPQADEKMRVTRSHRSCGGLTAAALITAARLGGRCAFAGILGEDEASRFVRQALAAEGIETETVVIRPAGRPVRSTIIIDEATGTRTVLFQADGEIGAHPELPAPEIILAARVLFIDQYGVAGSLRAMRIAKAAGIPVVADIEHCGPEMAEVIAEIDHPIFSWQVGAQYTGKDQPAEICQALWNANRKVVVVTRGVQGCWYRTAEGRGHVPAFAVPAVDTTGCGDVFHGAYACGLAQGLALEPRLQLAAAAAALKATRAGGHQGIPRRAEVDNFLRQPADRNS